MDNTKLTTRGKVVAIIAAITVIVGVNWVMSGKSLVCDWRHGVSPCELVSIP